MNKKFMLQTAKILPYVLYRHLSVFLLVILKLFIFLLSFCNCLAYFMGFENLYEGH